MSSNEGSSHVVEQPEAGSIKTRPDQARGPISPLIYGHFVEHFPQCVYGGYCDPASPRADSHGFRRDVVEAVRRVRPGIMRWPGGDYASAYHWRNGVGRAEARPTTYDPVWMSEETNQFGTAESLIFVVKRGQNLIFA